MNQQITREAADWLVELSTGPVDAAARERFDAWLRASPEHVHAFLDASAIWEDGAALPVDAQMTPAQLIERARAAARVLPMELPEPHAAAAVGRTPPVETHVSRRYLLAAAIAACLIGATFIWRIVQQRSPTYSTAIGQQLSIVLPDHSTAELNTLTRIRVHYSERERDIALLAGQAMFHVAKNAQRPFIVSSGQTRVRAVGTQFDVYKQPAATVVTVVEGRVAVYSASRSGLPPAAVSAGEQLVVDRKATVRNEHPDMDCATGWTRGELAFDSTPLAGVAREFNRYNVERLTIDGAALRSMRISGIFSSTDPSSLIRFLREQPGIRVVESRDGIHVYHD